MRKCPKCQRRYDNSWSTCLNCNAALDEAVDHQADPAKLSAVMEGVESVKTDMFRLQERISRIEKEVCAIQGGSVDESAVISESIKPKAEPVPIAKTKAKVEFSVGNKQSAGVYQKDKKSWGSNFEEVLGGQWFNKLGILAVVVGVTLLIGYSYQYMGALVKIGIGLFFGAGLLVSGIFLEKKKGFGVYGKSLIAGGWAISYFTTYAMHHIPQVRLIDNPVLAMAVLFLVSIASVLHIQRYRSQLASALTYLLIFVTLIISPLSLYTVAASLFVACSLILRKPLILTTHTDFNLPPEPVITYHLNR